MRLICILLVLLLLGGLIPSVVLYALAAEIPTKVELKTGVSINSNSNAAIDYSNLAEGFVSVKYTGGKDVKIKVQVVKTGGTTYTYNLNNKGNYETFPLVEGDGKYTIKVFENTTGTKYAQDLSYTAELKLRNEFLPFLYSNQYVNYTADSKVVAKAAELVKGKTTDLDKLSAVYNFVIKNFTYDTNRAKTVTSGYLPVVDSVLAEKKGICFDYAAVMSAMLRSQNIPCKLVVGYAGTIYHAWINVYLAGQGWIEKAIYFDGKNWTLMDPTFASSAKSSPEIMRYISNGSNYTQKYAY
ncbi:MAG TPA: transglutaminase-like domain-containing protein [Armatimonadota bacterium]|nr:transglutaminase-like domain-containing protein [Armatimonadota bacterium]